MSSDEITFESLAAQYGIRGDSQDLLPIPVAPASPHLSHSFARGHGTAYNDAHTYARSPPPQPLLAPIPSRQSQAAAAPVHRPDPILVPVPSLRDLRAQRRDPQQPSCVHAATPPPPALSASYSSTHTRPLAPPVRERSVQTSIHAYTRSSDSHAGPWEDEAPTRGPVVHGVELVPVSRLPAQFRSLYTFGLFNAVQSTCWDRALNSDENMVVCAPTGSGKTVVFELAMIRLLRRPQNAKQIIYMAPSKSLIAERMRDWTTRFGRLGFSIAEVTGDTDLLQSQAARKAQVIVTTVDKFEAMTRRTEERNNLMSRVQLLLIDEVHLLQDTRGPRLEAAVSRVKLSNERARDMIRILAISATIPNTSDIASWIGSAHVHNFGDDFRPVPLRRHVVGYPPAQATGFSTKLDQFLLATIQSHGPPALVFVPTRNGTVHSAETLAREYAQLRKSNLKLPWPLPSLPSGTKFDNPKLTDVVKHGVAFHHAGLSARDRKAIEAHFLHRRISVICATSTLATGNNLPAHLVVVRGTQTFNGSSWQEIADLDLLQMLGRAGRPGFDTEGEAVIMCASTMEDTYRMLASGLRPIESRLGSQLPEYLNAEIGLRVTTTKEALLVWLKSTFFYTRLKAQPDHYLKGHDLETYDSEKYLAKLRDQVLDGLQGHDLVRIEGDTITASLYGVIMAEHFISYESMLTLMDKSEEAIRLSELIHRIASASEFKDQRVRQGEARFFDELRRHKDMRFPPSRVSSPADKVSLLIQAVLAAIPYGEMANMPRQSTPALDIRAIFRFAPRLCLAALDIALVRKEGAFVAAAFELARAIHAESWDGSPAELKQLESIGDRYMRTLSLAGIGSILDVSKATSTRIESLLGRLPPFGSNLIKNAKRFPLLDLVAETLNVSVVPNRGVEVTVSIAISLHFKDSIYLHRRDAGGAISAGVLTLTSDQGLIDFRRLPLKNLLASASQTFTVRCLLNKPFQTIHVDASCIGIASPLVHVELQPDLCGRKFPELIGIDLTAATLPVSTSDEPKVVTSPQAMQPQAVPWSRPAPKLKCIEYLHRPAVQVPVDRPAGISGRKCKHKCAKPCRHACCNRTSTISGQKGKRKRPVFSDGSSDSDLFESARRKANHRLSSSSEFSDPEMDAAMQDLDLPLLSTAKRGPNRSQPLNGRFGKSPTPDKGKGLAPTTGVDSSRSGFVMKAGHSEETASTNESLPVKSGGKDVRGHETGPGPRPVDSKRLEWSDIEIPCAPPTPKSLSSLPSLVLEPVTGTGLAPLLMDDKHESQEEDELDSDPFTYGPKDGVADRPPGPLSGSTAISASRSPGQNSLGLKSDELDDFGDLGGLDDAPLTKLNAAERAELLF